MRRTAAQRWAFCTHGKHAQVYNPRVPGSQGTPAFSWPALALALAAVAASVLLGIYGPRIGDRVASPMMPLREVADAVDAIASRMSLEAARRPASAQLPDMADAARVCSDALGVAWDPPDLRDAGYRIVLAGPVPIPGSDAAVALLFEPDGRDESAAPSGADAGAGQPRRITIAPGPSADPSQRRDLVLAIARDSGVYAMFDDFGRAQPIGIGRGVLEESEDGMWAVMIWSDGELLLTAWAPDAATLLRLREGLGAP